MINSNTKRNRILPILLILEFIPFILKVKYFLFFFSFFFFIIIYLYKVTQKTRRSYKHLITFLIINYFYLSLDLIKYKTRRCVYIIYENPHFLNHVYFWLHSYLLFIYHIQWEPIMFMTKSANLLSLAYWELIHG